MKNLISKSMLVLTAMAFTGCSSKASSSYQSQESSSSSVHLSSSINEEKKVYIYVNGEILVLLLTENTSAEALYGILSTRDIDVDMNDYGGFEKVGDLGMNLVTNDEYISTVSGDVILYQGRNLVIYYGKNSYNFTRLGRIEKNDQAYLKNILGPGEVKIRLSSVKN